MHRVITMTETEYKTRLEHNYLIGKVEAVEAVLKLLQKRIDALHNQRKIKQAELLDDVRHDIYNRLACNYHHEADEQWRKFCEKNLRKGRTK